MYRPLKRVSSFVLVLLLLFVAFAVPAAQPARAIAVSAIVISAVLAAMAVWGIGTITAGMTSAEIQTWVEGKLNSWASSRGSTVANLIPVSGISVTATALLVLGSAAANAIKDFVSWLKTDLDLSPGTTTGVINTDSSYGGVDMDYFPSGFAQTNYYKQGAGAGVLYYRNAIYSIGGSGLYVFAWQTSPPDTVNYYVYSETPFVLSTTIYYAINGEILTEDTTYASHSDKTGYSIGRKYFEEEVTYQGETYANTYTFTLRDQTLRSNVNITNPATIGQLLSLKTGVSYNLPIDLVDPESLYINSGAAIGATLEGVTEHIITEVTDNTLTVTGIVAEEAPAYEVTGPVEVTGIQNIFPFCIPFDLYNFVSCLAAEPEAPSFTWRFYLPNVCDEEIEVDLTPFNTVAAILRTGLLLLFCVGLAFETRKLLRS